MIVFDLKCTAGHVFETWFGSTADYESQQQRGLVECPLCGDKRVEKAVMAPAVSPKGNRSATASVDAAGGDPERIKSIMQAMAKIQREVEKSADYVGERFADEARAMHLGETPQRGIYGEADATQVRSLLEDGVPVAPLPFPTRRRSDA